MSAPYWGELPGPKVASSHRRRMSEPDDYGYSNTDRRPSIDAPYGRKNRASVQTTNTEAPTESTFSPRDSPTASTITPHGLAPRPPSNQQGAPRDPPQDGHSHDRKQRRRNRNPDLEEFDDHPSATPPAAPDVPRGPPLSFRHPYGNGGLPYTYTASGSHAPPQPYPPGAEPEPEPEPEPEDNIDMDYYTRPSGRAVSQDHGRAPDDGFGRDPNAALREVAVQSRRPSGTSERRRKFANDRSPLQRLELTLDSITKEEKRARVEAAEQRARQRAAKRAAQIPPDQQMRFDNRQPPMAHGERRVVSASAALAEPVPQKMHVPNMSREIPAETRRDLIRDAPRDDTMQRGHSTRHRGLAAQQHLDDYDLYSSGALPDPDDDDYEPDSKFQEAESGIPQRNLSFRDRANRDSDTGVYTQEREPSPPRQPQPASSGGFSLTRNGSKKLKKDPPGDPGFYRRLEGEKRAQAPQRYSSQSQPRVVSGELPRSYRDKELPPDPPREDDSTHDVTTRGLRAPMPSDNQAMRRRATEPIPRHDHHSEGQYALPVPKGRGSKKGSHETREYTEDAAAVRRREERADSDYSSESSHHHLVSNMVFKHREDMTPGDGLYLPPQWLDEWKKGTVGTLSGTLLDVHESHAPGTPDQNKAWWEKDSRRGSHPYGARPRKAEAFDGEYDENAPTRFKPALYLKCGPLLRYCGIRKEKIPTRAPRGGAISERELWRGTVMIVTQDSESSYEIAPTLRLFVQDIELLPPPPHSVKGELSPEYVDPIAGHPKVGRRGETIYVRPVDHLEEAKDLSRIEDDDGLFEQSRSPPEVPLPEGETDLAGSFASRRRRVGIDGEKVQRYKDVRGFRLHADRGYTFWRFNIEVELRERQQRIAYRINRGPATGFWVPARGKTMNMMFYSCNGFSLSVKPDELSGPDPMWRDVLNNHQTQPFHLMIGGGDQIYNDCVADDCQLFGEWLDLRNPLHKHTAAFTPAMQDEVESFYLERYCTWFSQGLFSLANSQIPMVNMYDDHDIFDGYGSYPHHYMTSPVFRGLGAVAFKYYMLFQHQTILTETESSEPSWILGEKLGPYIGELSRSVFLSVGSKAGLLAVDCRMERTEHDVVSDKTWEKIMNRLYAEVRRGQVEHLLVVLGVPIAYPRLVWLENILTSRLMDPVKALGRTGMFGKAMNNIDGGVEVLDDLNDHWTAKNHKQERSIVIEDLQDLAIDKSVRVTILSGDVHLAAVGQFYSNPKLGLPKHKDPRYMPNVISSAIANTPPPDLMADVLNKRNKVHHFDKQTEEDMIPMFQQGVDGKPRNNKHLLPHRNWCSIREWAPGATPPPTPPGSSHDRSPSPPPPSGGGGGLLRRLSLSKTRSAEPRPDMSRDSVRGPRPPVSRGGGLFRSLSRRGSKSGEKPAKLTRSQSVGHGDAPKKGGFFSFGRSVSQRRPDDGGINGTWGDSDEDESWHDQQSSGGRRRSTGIRGGAAYDEYSEGDESYFTAQPPRRAQTVGGPVPSSRSSEHDGPPTRPFHRTPTGLTTKQKRKAEKFEVDLEGGLDICLNVEVNPKDPSGITVPYRLLVPKLFYEYDPAEDESVAAATPTLAPTPAAVPPPAEPREPREPSGFKRLLSFRKKPAKAKPREDEEDDYSDEDYDDRDRR